MKKLKKIVASLLAVLMLLGVAPITALAGEIELHRINTTQQPAEEPAQEPVLSSEDVLPEEDVAEAAEPAAVSSSEFVRIFHLDCGRKYFSVSEIEGMIDQLAENHFTHIQLAFGNNGFRFLLNEMSITANGKTYDSESVKTAITGGNNDYSTGKGAASNMLTESDMDAIIAHAKEKDIEVIPMLNTPGHMDALVSAMVTLGIRSSTGSEMSLTSDAELNFIKALQKKYIDYFAGKGSTRYNFAADEYSFNNLDNDGYTAFAQYVNDTAAMIKGVGMIPMCYNDGINYSGKTTSVPFDKDIEICYWAQAKNYASVQELSNAGFKIINNNDAWYYVLGDYLYTIWAQGQWGYEDALKGIQKTPVTQAKNAADKEIPVVGSVLCCWCDGPSVNYTDKAKKGTAAAMQQTNQESVYKLIQAMAAANPDYFKAEENPKEPEIVVSPVPGEVQAEKLANGNYKVAVKPNDTLTLTLSNSTAKLNWASNNAEVAAVADGKVTFTGKAGNVTITAEPTATRNDASAKAPYSITFEVEERGTTPKTIKLKVGQTKTETIAGNNYVNNVDWSEFNDSVATVNVVGKDKETVEYNATATASRAAYQTYVAGNLIDGNADTKYWSDGAQQVGDYVQVDLGVAIPFNAVRLTSPDNNDICNNADVKVSSDGNNWTKIGSYTGSATPQVFTFDNVGNVRYIKVEITTQKGNWWQIAEIEWGNSVNGNFTRMPTAGTAAAGQSSTTITFKGVSKGTTYVTVGDIRYTIEVSEKTALNVDGVEIPITIVDYRADGLLFDFSIDTNNTSIAYQLVQTAHGAEAATAQAAISGTTLTSLTPKDNATGRGTTWATNGNGSYIRTGMVEENLGANGMPVYTNATVQYVAGNLAAGKCRASHSGSAANWNDILYNTFLKTEAPRSVLDTETTTFSDAFKNSKTYDNISNAYDLAWYLLNTLYMGDTNTAEVTDKNTGTQYNLPIYGMADSTYNKLILVKDADGSYYMKAYTDGAKLKYDEEHGAIYNSSDSNDNTSRFMYPLCGKGYDAYLGDTTDNQAGAAADAYYPANPNGNYTLRGESQFVYHQDKGQFFEFTGDDDVYLFINGKLVLDLGGAHWSLSKTVNMDDIADKAGLVDGQVATFTFFYMERFSDCSNFGIRTSLDLAERAIEVEKKGYDGSYTAAELASGAIVENKKSVVYDLIVTNKGDLPMSNIKFEDTDTQGASLAFGSGVKTPYFTQVANGKFKLSPLQGYRIYKTDANGNEIVNTSETGTSIEALSAAVAVVTLEKNESLHVRYLQVTADIPNNKMEQYINTVNVTAVSGDQTLTDSAIHEIYSYNAEDTAKDYVVDFGLPLEIRDIFDPSAQPYIVNETLNLSKDSVIKYGDLEITGTGFNTVLKYTLKNQTTIDEIETIKLDVNYILGGTTVKLQKTIKIIPASTVYYEDDLVKFKNSDGSSGVVADQAAAGKWHTVGTKKTNVTQALDKLGDEHANVYGYDPAYADCSEYSLGSATKVTVDNTVSAESCPTATFTFKGTGFDIISLTDYQSGAIYIDVYKGNGTSGERVKGFFVNNYYGYKQENGKWVVDQNANDTLYQIPVIKASGLEYGTYTVVINVRYYASQDVQSKRAYSFWLDAIRVYDPTGQRATNLDYIKDKEGFPQFIKLRKELAGGNVTVGNEKLLFIDGGNIADITTYANFGPNNEVYLANGQAISFKLEGSLGIIDSIQIGAKAPNGNANLVVNNGVQKEIATATEMYYEISKNTDNSITIANTGTGILSLTNLKVTYSTEGSVSLASMNAEERTSAVMMVRAMFAPPAPTVFEPETFTVSLKNYKDVYVREYIKVTVTTSDDVKYITVGDKRISRYDDERVWGGFRKGFVKTGKRVWSYYVSFDTAGQQVISVVAYDADGLASEAVENTVNVKPRSAWRGKTSEWHI